jgi:hypothetical protein
MTVAHRTRIPGHHARELDIVSTPEEVAVYDPSAQRWVLIKQHRIVAQTTRF